MCGFDRIKLRFAKVEEGVVRLCEEFQRLAEEFTISSEESQRLTEALVRLQLTFACILIQSLVFSSKRRIFYEKGFGKSSLLLRNKKTNLKPAIHP